MGMDGIVDLWEPNPFANTVIDRAVFSFWPGAR